jgi:epoxyqueuosine reductase
MNTLASSSANEIKNEALRLGFVHCGIAPASALPIEEETNYRTWLRFGNFGNMAYLEKNFEKRLDPRNVMPGARSVIALLLNYFHAARIPAENNYVISKYAYGRDYQTIAKPMMENLVSFIRNKAPEAECRAFIDSGVLMEKYWAERSGIGWRGKNSLLINKKGGSFHFIGIILTSLDMSYDIPETDHCESCDRCIRDCPTGALEQPHVLNPLKCISYQTIENPEPIPEAVAERLHDRIFGCDICQDTCPYNRFSLPTKITGFYPSEEMQSMRKPDWEALSMTAFEEIFHKTGILRTGYRKFMKNIEQAGSTGHPSEKS